MGKVFDSPLELLGTAGTDLGHSDWLLVEQDRVNLFADATGDHQWIHVDPEKAKDGPFGQCIAHGYLTLSLINLFLPELIVVNGASMGINYGTEKVRFPSTVPVGARIRAAGEIVSAEEVKGGAIQVIVRVAVQVEGSDRPACVADTISRFVP